MKVRLVSTVTIDATSEQVYKYIKYLKYHQLWNPHLQDISMEGPIREGLEYETTNLLLGVKVAAKNRVRKVIPAKEFEVENTADPVHYLVNYRLQSTGKRTQVVCTTMVSTHGEAFAFTAPLLKLLARRAVQSDLQALKIAVEQQLA